MVTLTNHTGPLCRMSYDTFTLSYRSNLPGQRVYNPGMAGLRYTAIIPKKYTDASRGQGKLDDLLREIAVTARNELQKYPPWRPWKNPPKSGLYAGGKRTGTLRNGWGSYQLQSGRSVTLENRVPYSPYVQGTSRTQARAMRARDWQRVDEVADKAVKTAVAKVDLRP